MGSDVCPNFRKGSPISTKNWKFVGAKQFALSKRRVVFCLEQEHNRLFVTELQLALPKTNVFKIKQQVSSTEASYNLLAHFSLPSLSHQINLLEVI